MRRTASWAQPARPAPPTRVRLGFADGAELELAEGDPAAMALQAVAGVLTAAEPGVKRAPARPTTDDGGVITARRTS